MMVIEYFELQIFNDLTTLPRMLNYPRVLFSPLLYNEYIFDEELMTLFGFLRHTKLLCRQLPRIQREMT
jgi:hypothetical protein